MPRSRRLAWLALAALFGVLTPPLAGCELVVKLDHFDDGCPPGRHGPTSVRIQAATGTYCIDSTEVTNAQYQEFLTALAQPGAVKPVLPPACAGQTDFRPLDNNNNPVQVPPGEENFPANQVNWCDGYAYCSWAGKRLCGQIGGGPLAEGASESNPALAQWFNACSRGGVQQYPYGNTFDYSICGGGGAGMGSPLGPVETRPRCVGGYPGIHDIVGSVWEWTDICDSAAPPPATSNCHAYGGAYDSIGGMELSCAGFRNWKRTAGALNIGIRCCADL